MTEQDLLARYKRSLEGLTPGGPEFTGNPERCATFVTRLRDSQGLRIQRLNTQVRNLQMKCDRLDRLLKLLEAKKK